MGEFQWALQMDKLSNITVNVDEIFVVRVLVISTKNGHYTSNLECYISRINVLWFYRD